MHRACRALRTYHSQYPYEEGPTSCHFTTVVIPVPGDSDGTRGMPAKPPGSPTLRGAPTCHRPSAGSARRFAVVCRLRSVRRARGFIVGIVMAVVTCSPGVAGAAPPSVAAGARFDGKGSTGLRNFVRFNKTGTRLVGYELAVPTTCNDGRKRRQSFLDQGERPTPLSAAGGFSFDSGKDRGNLRTGVRRPTPVVFRTTFSGTIQDANTVSVTVTTTVTGKRLKCSGTDTFTLYRDGTPQAPYRNETLATGNYRAAGRGIKVTKLSVVGPGHYVTALHYSTNVPCRGGYNYDQRATYIPFLLDRDRGRGYRVTDLRRIRIERGVVGRERATLSLRFRKQGSVYRVSGRLRVRSVLRRNGKRVRCGFNRPFRGRFVSGPG